MKTTFTFVLAFVFQILFNASISNSQTTVAIRLGPSTGQDVLVLSNFPNLNLNGHNDYLATLWTAQGNQYIGRTFFQFYFNQIPSNANIINATLSLWANPNPINPQHSQLGHDNTAFLYRIQTSWNETQVTWNEQPEYTTLHKVTIPGTSNPNQNYPEINVTQLVKDMLKNPQESFGFMLVQKDEEFFIPDPWFDPWYRSLNFAPSTYSDSSKRPLLVIIYNPVGISPSGVDVPVDYTLDQNFPNPFNPVTNIEIEIPRTSFVRLSVYDQLGREISMIVNEQLYPGTYKFHWDGTSYSSGQYYLKMEAGGKVISKKMMLIK